MANNVNEMSPPPVDFQSLGEQAVAKARSTSGEFFECPVGVSASVPVSGSVLATDGSIYTGDPGEACATIVKNLWKTL